MFDQQIKLPAGEAITLALRVDMFFRDKTGSRQSGWAGSTLIIAKETEGLWPPAGLEGIGGGAGLSHSLSELVISLH
jgi:hypothetical protein